MIRSPRTALSTVLSQVVVAGALVGPVSMATIVLSASAAHAADVNCPSATAPTLSGGIYQVDDSSHLMWIRDDTTRWDDSYVLTADIDMGTCIWDSPIAPVSSRLNGVPFSGVFDGGGHTIDNLTVAVNTKSLDDSQAELAGFIGFLGNGAALRSVTFDNALVSLDDTTDYDDSVYNIAMIYAAVAVAEAGNPPSGFPTVSDVSVVNSDVRVTVADVRLYPSYPKRHSSVGGVVGFSYDMEASDLSSSGSVISNMNEQTSRGLSNTSWTYSGGALGSGYGTLRNFTSTDDSVLASSAASIAVAGAGVGESYLASAEELNVVRPDVLALSPNEAYAGGAIGTSYSDGVSAVTVVDGMVQGRTLTSANNSSAAGGAIAYSASTYVKDAQVSGTSVEALGSGDVSAGGVVGHSDDDTLSELSSNASVSARSSGFATSVVFAGGLVGWQSFPDIMNSLATGDASSWSDDAAAYVYAGGLVGYAEDGDVRNSYASGNATSQASGAGALSQAAGLVAVTDSTFGVIADSYSSGVPSASAASSADDTVGGLVGTVYAGSVTQSYWNTTTSGVSVSDGGTGLTTAQMQDPSSFAGWTIVDGWQAQTYSGSPALPTSPFWGQCDVNSGFPFLLWEYASSPCAVPPPPPPPVYPPSAPRDVTAVAGDKAAAVSWSVPSSSGSFAISNYQVRSTPASDGCMTAELTCEISHLVNGTAYTFEVRALNGAGWGPWSLASEPVTPGPAVSIVITGTRGTVKGKPGVIVDGTTTGLVGATVTPWFRFPGQSSYSEGTGARTVDTEGRFTWVRKTGKRLYVYFRSSDAKSNRLVIDR